jgi:hypothetical protein
LFDWDEINFAESAREMLLTGDYLTVQIDFKPFWEKPPLFFWLQVLAMKAFGQTEFAARLPNAIVGIITLQVVYAIGQKLHNKAFGFLWALAFLGSITPHLYFKTGIIDPTFNLLIFCGLYTSLKAFEANFAIKNLILAGLFIGLAVLTKGPVAILLWGLTLVVFGYKYQLKHPQHNLSISILLKPFLIVGITTLGVASFWFALEYSRHGWWFFEQFFAYQIRLFSTPDAGHEQPFYYHFIVILLGCFPASIFAIPYLLPSKHRQVNDQNTSQQNMLLLMQCLFWVVLFLFSIVRTKIVHYSSMAWFPVTYLASLQAMQLIKSGIIWHKWLKTGLIVVGTLIGIILTALPLIGMYAFEAIAYIEDPFVVGNLQAPVTWVGWEWALGLLFCILIIVLVWRQKIIALYSLVAGILFLYLALVVPRIEPYTQGAAIDFYRSFEDQDVYIHTLGFKSYAHLYYFNKQKPKNLKSYDENWLLNGLVDKPTYFVAKNTELGNYSNNPNLQFIKEENGFVFFRRKPRF